LVYDKSINKEQTTHTTLILR